MNRLRTFVALVASVAACLPLVAWSAQGDLPLRSSGWYVGAGAGYAQADLKTDITDIGGNDVAWKLFGGYRLPQVWLPWNVSAAFDAAIVNLGEVTDNQLGAEFALEIDGIDLSVTGYLPITRRLDLFGKLGMYLWDAELSTGGVTLDEDDGSDLSYGLGLAYQTGGQWGAQLEIEGYDTLDGAVMGSLSVTYQFK
jgi:hypothetical protein